MIENALWFGAGWAVGKWGWPAVVAGAKKGWAGLKKGWTWFAGPSDPDPWG